MIRRALLCVGLGVACSAAAQPIRVESSSAAYPLTKGVAERLQGGGGVILSESGSASALRRLCAGELEFAAVSRPIDKSELAACERAKRAFIEVPIAFDALAVVVNPRNDFVASLSVEQLRAVWAIESQAKLTHWSGINPAYPLMPVKLYAPEARAERGNYFNEAVLGKGREARRDVTSSADDNVLVQAVARDQNALGYVPLAYYLANPKRLKLVPIAPSTGATPVAPSAEAVAKGLYQPLSRPLFLYASAKALEQPQAASFAQAYLAQIRDVAPRLGYVPLADPTYEAAGRRLAQRTAGSLWAGEVPVGLTLQSLQQRLGAL
jgi:phosphate transport system substrate-binding protein